MTRETQANLILIVVVLAVLIPGAVVVVRKKYDPAVKPMGRPDGVRRHMVFTDPTPAPPGMRRMMPAVTASWVNDLSLSRLGVPMRREADAGANRDAMGQPVMSDARLAQLVSVRTAGDDTMDLGVLVWNLPRGTDQAAMRVVVDAPAVEAVVVTSEMITVPAEVKRDLEYSGLPAPPQQALWGVARLTGRTPEPTGVNWQAQPLRISIHCVADGRTFTDALTFTARQSQSPATSGD